MTILLSILASVLTLAPLEDAESFADHPDAFVLIDRDLTMSVVRVAKLDSDQVDVFGPDLEAQSRDRASCLAFLRANPRERTIRRRRSFGLLELADGRRFPGALAESGNGNEVAWVHPWLDTVRVPIDDVSSVLIDPRATLPEPGAGDVVALRNGDRVEGFLVALGDPIELDINGTITKIPIDRAAAVRLVPKRSTSDGTRIWFRDGTVLDVASVEIGDDGYVRLRTHSGLARQPDPTPLGDINAILLKVDALLPFAALEPSDVSGPPLRYEVPVPEEVGQRGALDIVPLRLRGPLQVRYRLPAGATRFAARAVVPADARTWGDYELIVRSNRQEILRERLSGADPVLTINLAVTPGELELELLPGAHGPIQDVLVLEQAVLLIED